MEFYAKRSVYEQANRLPLELREKYQETQLDRIEIDGETLQGYFEYSFLEEKSYAKQPVRADDGSIPDLNKYDTFMTPRIIIRYNMMGIDDYRKLMKLMKRKNTFNVTCYDVVEDKRVTHQMYFAPTQMPIIYQQYLQALGVQDFTIELIGTNVTTQVRITYEYNFPQGINIPISPQDPLIETNSEFYNKKILIGGLSVEVGGQGLFFSSVLSSYGYDFKGWNTQRDGSGVYFRDNDYYYVSKDLILYAQWNAL
jgi:uncharacterized repeat protein (TIGR02543 family)